ncbi:MAG: C40 family peptidase [Hyphomicrobiaceae bacterium]
MTENRLDPRLHAFRPDLADATLSGQVTADRYTDGQNAQLIRTAPLRTSPAPDAMLMTEGIGGEMVQVFDVVDGWAWIQLHRDGYVGYAPADALAQSFAFTSHFITAPTALVFPQPDLKQPPIARVFLGTEVSLKGTQGDYVELMNGGFVHGRTVSPLGRFADDFVSVAERFIGVPYLWGGKTAAGLDCSGLVQIACQAADLPCPRDSDMQMSSVGQSLGASPPGPASLMRGDLLFWTGHVAILTDKDTLLHANAYHMEVVREPLMPAVERIAADTGPVTDVRRHMDHPEPAEAPLIGTMTGTG